MLSCGRVPKEEFVAYTYGLDKYTGAMVGLLSGRPLFNEDADYGKLIASISELAASPAPKGEHIFVLEVTADCPPPSALWRKKFAISRDQLQQTMIFYLVSSSTVMRGVITAVNWVSPSKKLVTGAYPVPSVMKLYDDVMMRGK
jgi:hypothetical protein